MKRFAYTAFLCLALVMACNQTDTTPTTNILTEELSQDRSQAPTLQIGLIPEANIFNQYDRYKPLAEYLSERTGRNIELKMIVHYGNIIDNFIKLNLDGAFLGSFSYVLAHKKLGLQVLARPESLDGISTYHGIIFVRKGSGIRTVQNMKGKTFVFVDKATTAGFLLPMVLFEVNGIEDYRTFFKESYFAGTHGDAILDVLRGKADIGAAKHTVFNRMALENPSIGQELTIVATSPEVPENALAVRKGLDETLKTQLKDALLNMHNDLEGQKVLMDFGARRFIETVNDDYEPVYDYAATIHLDLEHYNYQN